MIGDRVVDAVADPALGERSGERVAILVDDADRVLVVDVRGTRGDRRHHDAAQVGVEECAVVLALFGPTGKLAELHAADRRVHVGHPRIEADDLVLVALFHALVAQQPDSTSKRLVDTRHHSTLTGGHVLRRVEREHRELAERPDGLPLPGRRVRLRGILVDREPMLVGDRAQGRHIGRVAVEMHGHDALGSRRDCGLDGRGVEAEVVRLDVGEHGRRAGECHRVGRGREGE
ncbi:unannotated protein [freshwater metagenome]|uniref:Unannotated protein n=1 Tax=freshwater metagenome TaxID=449393 RepID=A0A6J7C675_9ZZZZ